VRIGLSTALTEYISVGILDVDALGGFVNLTRALLLFLLLGGGGGGGGGLFGWNHHGGKPFFAVTGGRFLLFEVFHENAGRRQSQLILGESHGQGGWILLRTGLGRVDQFGFFVVFVFLVFPRRTTRSIDDDVVHPHIVGHSSGIGQRCSSSGTEGKIKDCRLVVVILRGRSMFVFIFFLLSRQRTTSTAIRFVLFGLWMIVG